MKAIVFDKNHKPSLKNITLKRNSDSDVVVKVEACGLCGSDLNKIKDESFNLERIILGHEISGVVYDPGGSNFRKNDRVVVNPLVPCYSCESCKKGNYGLCNNLKIIGRDLDGGFAEFVSVPPKNVYLINKDLSFEEATFVDLVACGIHSYNLSGKPSNLEVLVIGDGPLGLISAFIFNTYENKVFLEGKHNFNIKVAREQGIKADYFHSKLFKDDKYDVVLECVGRNQSETINEAIDKVKKRGKIIVSGVFNQDSNYDIHLRKLFYKEALMQGSNTHGIFEGLNEFQYALNLLEERRINVRPLITHIFKLKDFDDGLKLRLERHSNVIKIVYKNESNNL